MDDHERRGVHCLVSRVRSVCDGRPGLYGIPWSARRGALDVLLAASATTMSIERGVQTALTADGDRLDVKDVEYDEGVRARIAARIAAWLVEPTNLDADLVARIRPSLGFQAIAARMGVRADAMAALAFAAHQSTFARGDAVLTLHHGVHADVATYRRGRVRWQDGRLVFPTSSLPDTLRDALRGRPVSTIVDDDAIGHLRILDVDAVDRREGVGRAITYGHGRREHVVTTRENAE